MLWQLSQGPSSPVPCSTASLSPDSSRSCKGPQTEHGVCPPGVPEPPAVHVHACTRTNHTHTRTHSQTLFRHVARGKVLGTELPSLQTCLHMFPDLLSSGSPTSVRAPRNCDFFLMFGQRRILPTQTPGAYAESSEKQPLSSRLPCPARRNCRMGARTVDTCVSFL